MKWIIKLLVLFADAAFPTSRRKATTHGPRAGYKPTVCSEGNTSFVFESSVPCWNPVDIVILPTILRNHHVSYLKLG